MGLCFSTSRKAEVRPTTRSEMVFNDSVDKPTFRVQRILPFDESGHPRPRKPHI